MGPSVCSSPVMGPVEKSTLQIGKFKECLMKCLESDSIILIAQRRTPIIRLAASNLNVSFFALTSEVIKGDADMEKHKGLS